jgi:proteasome lid subunit RPN8/RPN11
VTVRVRREVLLDIEAHARAESPNECCGLLVGLPDLIEGTCRARNELNSPVRYRIDPHDHFTAIRTARGLGLDIVGAYHSHPASAPVPSRIDLAEAVPGSFLYLIAGRDESGAPSIRAWRLADGNFAPVPFVTI